jgi:hypothetical protein
MLDSGVPALFVHAGGDWEYPICFLIYWDGKTFRGYVPTKGQAYNKKQKAAIGNYDETDPTQDEAEEMVDETAFLADCNSRIKSK